MDEENDEGQIDEFANAMTDEEISVSGSENESAESRPIPLPNGTNAPLRAEVYYETDDDIEVEVEPTERQNRSTTRRFGDIFIQAFRRHPLRLTRQFRIHHQSQPVSEDEEEQDTAEIIPENAENFDTDLPAEHSYLGNMSRVSGVNYLEVGKLYHMLLFTHKYLLFPGETLPMIIPDYIFDSNLNPEEDGLQFGLVFPSTLNDNKMYGVSCQIYEKGSDESGNVVLKSRAHQRFVVTRKDNPNFDDIPPEFKTYAYIRILPEIYLPDPLSTIQLGSMNRFRGIPSMEKKLRILQASTTIWPAFIYEPYRMEKIVEKAKICLESYKINSMPVDPILLSFWLGRNLLFNLKDKYKIFLTNSVNTRMQIIGNSVDNEKFFCCARCRTKIANCNLLFAMSKHGVQSNYINPGGCIHETNTIRNHSLIKEAVFPTGVPSTEFSWFPGYSWQIILCRLCDMHLGWKFASTKPNMVPKIFYGLAGSNLKVLPSGQINPLYFQSVSVSS